MVSTPSTAELIHEINHYCIRALIEAARLPTNLQRSLISYLRPTLLSLNDAQIARISMQPLLLVDMRFSDSEWWRLPKKSLQKQNQEWNVPGSFQRKHASLLSRMVTVFAWQGLRSDPSTTQVALGCSTEVLRVIRALSLESIVRIAESHSCHVRLRWPHHTFLWNQILQSGWEDSPDTLRLFRLRTLQLITAETFSI